MPQSIVNLPTGLPTEMIRIHFDHYMKLLDLYETRQTNSFNYALLVYGFGMTAGGFIFEKGNLLALATPTGTADSYLMVAALLVIYSIAIPLILLPLFYLYVDVSIYCAALSVGNRQFHRNCGFPALEESDPGLLAFEWLQSIHQDLTPHYKRRIALFLWAPLLGCLVSIYALAYAVHHCHLLLVWLSIIALLSSGTALYLTISAAWNNTRVRDESIKARLPESDEAYPPTTPASVPGGTSVPS